MKRPENGEDRGLTLRAILVPLLGVTVVLVLAGLVIYASFGDWTQRGLFGDMFGAVNTLFSGLAFAGVIYAILLQREELRLQRQELKLTRDELKRSAEAQERSARLLQEQLDQAKLEANEAASPIFQCESGRGVSDDAFEWNFINGGAGVTDLEVSAPGTDGLRATISTSTLGPGGSGKIKVSGLSGTQPVLVDVQFMDRRGQRRSVTLKLGLEVRPTIGRRIIPS